MTLSTYQATVPTFLQVLSPIAALVDKARAHCAASGLSEEALCGTRLAPDMWPLAKQVTATCRHSAGAIAAITSGETGPDLSPAPTDFAALAAQVAAAIAALQAADADQLNAAASGDVVFKMGERQMVFTGPDYLMTFALPNFYFHAAMVYAILRSQGLEIGKRDFLGALRTKP